MDEWIQRTCTGLGANYDPEPVLLDRWLGLLLSYPDRAVDDLCEALAYGRDQSRFREAHLPAKERYGGAMPIFDFAPEHTSDPGIVATCAEWQALLEGVYNSEWHQQLVADPAFQEARRTRAGA